MGIDLNVIAEIEKAHPNPVIHQRLKEYQGALLMDHWKNHFELHYFAHHVPREVGVLDFGCGTGHLTVLASKAGWIMVGYEPDECSRLIAEYINKAEEGRALFYDVIPDLAFGWVWMCHVLEHIPMDEWHKVFSQVNGLNVLAAVPAGEGYNSPDHINHWYALSEFVDVLSDYVIIKLAEEDAAMSVYHVVGLVDA